jgi:hypothetical protein
MDTSARFLLAMAVVVLASACSPGRAQDRGAGAIDLTEAMRLQSAAGCRFDALTNHAFEGLLMIEGESPFAMTHAPEVVVGNLRLHPQMTRERNTNYPDGVFYRSAASFPAGSRWHGLTLLEMWYEYSYNPGIDHAEQRGMTFAESADRLRETLLTVGADVPVEPDFRELDDWGPYAGGCSATIQIASTARGAALVCSYGC